MVQLSEGPSRENSSSTSATSIIAQRASSLLTCGRRIIPKSSQKKEATRSIGLARLRKAAESVTVPTEKAQDDEAHVCAAGRGAAQALLPLRQKGKGGAEQRCKGFSVPRRCMRLSQPRTMPHPAAFCEKLTASERKLVTSDMVRFWNGKREAGRMEGRSAGMTSVGSWGQRERGPPVDG